MLTQYFGSRMNNSNVTWASENDFRLVQRKCLEMIHQVEWLNNTVYDEHTTLADAVALIKENKDGGLNGVKNLIPGTSCFHEWMDLAFIITYAYNRTHTPAYYTILRKGFCCNHHK